MPFIVCPETYMIDSRKCGVSRDSRGDPIYIYRFPTCIDDIVSVKLEHAIIPASEYTVRTTNNEFSVSIANGPYITYHIPIGFATPSVLAAQISALPCGLSVFFNATRKHFEITSRSGKAFSIDLRSVRSAFVLLGLPKSVCTSSNMGYMKSGMVSQETMQTPLVQIHIEELQDISSPLECIYIHQLKDNYQSYSIPRHADEMCSLPIHPPRSLHRLSLQIKDQNGRRNYDPNGKPFFILIRFGVRRRVLKHLSPRASSV